jgi:hypothetical protein
VWWLHYDSAGFTRAFKLYADALQGRTPASPSRTAIRSPTSPAAPST